MTGPQRHKATPRTDLRDLPPRRTSRGLFLVVLVGFFFMDARHQPIKAVIVGDGACGKTSLLMVMAQGKFPQEYVPTAFDKYRTSVQLEGRTLQLELWDTAGQEDYDRLRPLSYADAKVILLCYDVTNATSFDNVRNKWYPEVTHFCPKVPILLVGCKTDLRNDKDQLQRIKKSGQDPISYHKGQALANNLGAVAYLECSARLRDNVETIFQRAAAATLRSPPKNVWRSVKKKCTSCVLG
ncbi:rho-related GTP-binding protein RhoD [Tachyglossus aculeatus]|uniref:rho-related GTP-binding protein RhoD n=1 Tax=Tachyglossus aculeatus TaxID=9261 RepID=UPI0018F43835|nr:rho-related GTP-binding protein RhoD [Tachyglossus aculeatus]